MNFEDFVKAWQRQKSDLRATITDPEALLREIRLKQRQFKAAYFMADMFIIGVDTILIPWFLYAAIHFRDWSFYLMAFSCFFISVFILVDRWLQRRKQPITNDSLTSCIKSSLIQVRHQIWRSKSNIWWYVLPLEIGFAAVAASWGWRAFDFGRGEGWATAFVAVAFVLFFGLLFALIGWITYWLNQRGLKNFLEPRRKELESLLASLNEDT